MARPTRSAASTCPTSAIVGLADPSAVPLPPRPQRCRHLRDGHARGRPLVAEVQALIARALPSPRRAHGLDASRVAMVLAVLDRRAGPRRRQRRVLHGRWCPPGRAGRRPRDRAQRRQFGADRPRHRTRSPSARWGWPASGPLRGCRAGSPGGGWGSGPRSRRAASWVRPIPEGYASRRGGRRGRSRRRRPGRLHRWPGSPRLPASQWRQVGGRRAANEGQGAWRHPSSAATTC